MHDVLGPLPADLRRAIEGKTLLHLATHDPSGKAKMVRVGAERYTDLLKERHAREMDFTGKALKGFIYVCEAGIESDAQLMIWVNHSLEFVRSWPPK